MFGRCTVLSLLDTAGSINPSLLRGERMETATSTTAAPIPAPISSPSEPMGVKLRRQRRRLGLTLDELAGRTGISKPYLSLIETGRVPNPPSDEKLRRLEQSLGFTPGELLTQAHLQRTPRDVRAVLAKLIEGQEKRVAGLGVRDSGK